MLSHEVGRVNNIVASVARAEDSANRMKPPGLDGVSAAATDHLEGSKMLS